MARYRSQIRRWEVLALIAVLVGAIVLRTWRLGDVPPGLTHDEASNGHDAAAILRGVRPIYFTVGYGHEPLYPYSVALLMAFLGKSTLALRLTTVAWGTGLILLSYLLGRRLLGALPGLMTAAWMAVSFWCLMTSRVGLRAVTAAVTFTASAYAFWRAIPVRSSTSMGGRIGESERGAAVAWLWMGLSGLLLGASIYTYMASRALPAVYVLFVLYLLVLRLAGGGLEARTARTADPVEASWRTMLVGQWGRQALGVGVLLLVAAIVAAPLVHYLAAHPDAEQRLEQLGGPIREALGGRFGALWRHVSRSLPMLTVRGDPLWLYNIPGRPLLGRVAGPFLYAGLFVCLWRWRDPRCAFLLLWFVVGVAPALVTGPDATVLRSIAVQPAVFLIVALGMSTIVRFLARRGGSWVRLATGSGVAVLLLVTGIQTAEAYFDVWAEHRDVRVAYHHALVEQARYLDAQPEGDGVALSSIYPGRFHDPYTMEISLRRDDLSLRWFDGRGALVFPAGGESRVVIPTIAPLDEALSPIFMRRASLLHSERFRPDDLVSAFHVYRFDGRAALDVLLPAVTEYPVFWSGSDTFREGDPRKSYEPLALPVNVDGIVELAGYDLLTPAVEPGGEVTLLTLWRIQETLPLAEGHSRTGELVAFAHALAPDGSVVGQADRLDVPSWHWKPGDAFVQVHRFPVATDVSPGQHSLEVGFYRREDLRRLPVLADGVPVDDRILLRPLEVESS